jgi:hypothetical protein
MERLSGVFREAAEEEFHEGVNILSSNGTSVDGAAIFGVRISDVDGLVKEDHIGMGIPAVGVIRRVSALVGDAAWTKLEQKASRRAASWATVEPHHKGRILGRGT